MAWSARAVFGTGREIVGLTRTSRLPFLAAATAYYAFVSVFPLIVLGIAVGSLVGGDALAQQGIATVSGVLSPSGQDLLREALSDGAGRSGATLVGIGVLFWSGLRVFRGLTLAFATVYGTDDETTLRGQLSSAAVALLALGIGVLAVVGGTIVLSQSGIALVGFTQSVAITLALVIVLLPLYVVLPNVSVGLREAVPGAVTAAVGWTLLSVIFRLYAANAGQFEVYGVIGGVLLFVTWLYVGASVLLVGAVVNAVLAGRDRQFQLPPPPSSGRDPTMTGTEGAGDDRGADGTDTVDSRSPTDSNGDRTAQSTDDDTTGDGAVDPDAEIEELRAEIDRLEDEIDDRTVHRETVESDLKRYVRRRVRRGHAHGWGPYLVLLYGTVMTLGAFYFLGGGWAILAMLVIWLSTLGLYALMLVVGLTLTLVGAPGRLLDRIRDWRR